VLAAHGRNPLRAELAANATIMRTVKDEATRTRVGAGAGPARPAPRPGPPAPRPGPPAPRPAPFALPVAAPAATTTTIDALERPLYFLYHGMPYGTGPDIPSGRR
jgi:translation initiation factor IF-2